MLEFNSNFNNFIYKYKKQVDKCLNVINKSTSIVAKEMIKEMKELIIRDRDIWKQTKSQLENISGDDFNIVERPNSCAVYIGSTTTPLRMNDGTFVNPYFFIEFGFGIRGERKPKKNRKEYNWEYNVNNHDKYWIYMGTDNRFYRSIGREGINFMYNVIERYRTKWKEIVIKHLEGEINESF